jgi:hypothetical protein
MGKPPRSKIRNLARVEMTLRNVIYLSYRFPHDIIRPRIPLSLPLAVIGNDTVFISIVLLTSRAVHPTIIPAPCFNYEQVNVRTYVRDPQSGESGVYFLNSAVSSGFISMVTKSIGLTWEYSKINRTETVSDDGDVTINIDGSWNEGFTVEVNSNEDKNPVYALFKSGQEAADYLIRPLKGFFGSSQSLRRFRIWHPPVEPVSVKLIDIRFPLQRMLQLEGQIDLSTPHSVFLVKNARFYIYLPPVRVED